MNAAPTMPALTNDAQRGSHCVQRLVSRESCLREISVWCKSRSRRQEDAKLLREAQCAYKTGPYAGPTARFAKHLEEEIAWKRKHWESLEEAMKSEAAAIGAANAKLCREAGQETP